MDYRAAAAGCATRLRGTVARSGGLRHHLKRELGSSRRTHSPSADAWPRHRTTPRVTQLRVRPLLALPPCFGLSLPSTING